jgi:hypothetical protein
MAGDYQKVMLLGMRRGPISGPSKAPASEQFLEKGKTQQELLQPLAESVVK